MNGTAQLIHTAPHGLGVKSSMWLTTGISESKSLLVLFLYPSLAIAPQLPPKKHCSSQASKTEIRSHLKFRLLCAIILPEIWTSWTLKRVVVRRICVPKSYVVLANSVELRRADVVPVMEMEWDVRSKCFGDSITQHGLLLTCR